MMKNKKRIVSILAMALALVMTLSGCSAIKGLFTKDVTGNYTTDLRLVDFLGEEDAEAMESVGVDFSNFKMRMNLTMNEDKTFKLEVDEDFVLDSFNQVMDDNADSVMDAALAEAGMEGLSDSDKDSLAALSGYDDWDALKEAMVEEVKTQAESSFEGSFDEATVTGKYEVDGDTVVFTVDDDSEASNMDEAEIGKDGSLTIDYTYEEQTMNMVFVKSTTEKK